MAIPSVSSRSRFAEAIDISLQAVDTALKAVDVAGRSKLELMRRVGREIPARVGGDDDRLGVPCACLLALVVRPAMV